MPPTSSTANSTPSSPGRRFRFTKQQHLLQSSRFKEIFDRRLSARGNGLSIFAAPNGLGWTRLGLSVSRKHGGAVQRNRLKRQLREAFRLAQHDLPAGLDLILIPDRGRELVVADLGPALIRLTRQLARRAQHAK